VVGQAETENYDTMIVMGLREVLINLNELKSKGIIQDYAIAGGYAVMFYDVPLTTYDLDVLVALGNYDDYHKLYEYHRIKGNKIEDVYIYIEGMPVQFLPNYISPLFNNAIEEAPIIEFEGVEAKFVTAEHLMVLLLTVFRPNDKIRVRELLGKVNKAQVLDIIDRFGDDKDSLFRRYKEILESA
jgi:predicted nucleotidyltransferase